MEKSENFTEKEHLKKVIVLGAGASIAYGFPSGAQLVKDIIKYCKQGQLKRLVSLKNIDNFIENLNNSRRDSIDAFLKDRPEYRYIGKLVIASVLRNKESPTQLIEADAKNDWYKLFIDSIFNVEKVKKNEIPLHNTTIITFNYDRTFEEYCYRVLSARGWEHEHAKKAVESFNIMHVYGRLAHLDWEVKGRPTSHGPSASAYGGEFHHIPNFSQEQEPHLLAVIGEDIQTATKKLHSVLEQTDEIYFMGFGYHPTNMNVLGSKEFEEYQDKRFYGTCRGQNKVRLKEKYSYMQVEELDCIDFTKKYFS